MRKLFTLLFSLILTSALTQAVAQYKMYVWSNGTSSVYSSAAVDSVTFKVDKNAGHTKTINGHIFVDLGLPSGLLWAETNVGAQNSEDDGNYYAWGETVKKETYTEENSSTYGVERYDTLKANEDAATAVWGSGVRIPTSDELSELLNEENCKWTWTKVGGKYGYQVVSKANGCEIFLPASGYRRTNGVEGYGANACYWSSTPRNERTAYYFNLFSGARDVSFCLRYLGITVRPVADAVAE